MGTQQFDLGQIGIWSGFLRRADAESAVVAAGHIERLGFKTAWFPSGGAGQLQRARALLEGTSTLTLATGILNVHMDKDPEVTATAFHEIDSHFRNRLMLGLGVGHPEVIDREAPGRYGSPLATVSEYLDGLDAAATPVPLSKRSLAALGPRMLELAARRTAGALPYLTTPEHTRHARRILGEGKLLAPEQGVILETDDGLARTIARKKLAGSLALTNYTTSFLRLGFNVEDFTNGGSDRLVDALFAWGDADAVLRRVEAHRQAGADHVAIQVVTADETGSPLAQWEMLAAAMR